MGKTKRITKKLDSSDEKILSYLIKGDYLSITQLSKIAHMTKQAIEKRVRDLKMMGKISTIKIRNKKYIKKKGSEETIINEMTRILSIIKSEKNISSERLKEIIRTIETETVSCTDFGIVHIGKEVETQVEMMIPLCLKCEYSLNEEGKEYLQKFSKKTKKPTSS